MEHINNNLDLLYKVKIFAQDLLLRVATFTDFNKALSYFHSLEEEDLRKGVVLEMSEEVIGDENSCKELCKTEFIENSQSVETLTLSK